MPYEDKSFQDFQGTKISKWDRAFQLSQHSYVLTQAEWKLSLDMWSDPQCCIQFVQTLEEFWDYASAAKRNREPNDVLVVGIDKDFDNAFKIALEIPNLTDSNVIIKKTRQLTAFARKIKSFAQSTGWGLPENKRDVTENDMLEKLGSDG